MEKNRYRPILNNGVYPDVSLQQARAEVAWYKQCGYGGFAINGSTHQPLKDVQDWLPGYLESCKNYVQAAKEQELDVWLFDEWGYPSGCACGQVLTQERFRAKKYRVCYDIVLEAGQSITLPCTPRFVCASVFPVDYFSFYCPQGKGTRVFPQNHQVVYTASQKVRLVAVEWEYLTFVTHVMKKAEPGDPTIGTIDLLNREAVQRFLQCMHEWYVKPLGEEFGKTVQGFFYDEPEICWHFPYSEELPAYFEKSFGYALEEVLPELLVWSAPESGLINLNGGFERLHQAYEDYTHAWTQLLAESFYGQIEAWCHAHNLLSIGHQDLDNQLKTLRTVSGDFWQNSAHNDRPGIDVIWDQIAPGKFVDFPRYAGCAKRTLQKSGAISETFAEMGPSMYPDLMRYDMEHQILRGIDQFFLYTNHDPEDLNVSHFAAAVNDRVTRTATLCNQGRPGAQLAVYVPMDEVAFAAAHADPHQCNADPQPWQQVEQLAARLCYRPVDYDYAWQGTLAALAGRGITTLLLAALTRLSKEEEQAMRSFCAQGGTVVCLGKPCLQLEDVAAFWADADAYLGQLDTDLSLAGEFHTVSLTTRLLEDQKLYFLLNESNRRIQTLLGIRSGGGVWQQMDPLTGAWQDADRCEHLVFQARELKIFRRLQENRAGEPPLRGASLPLHDWTLEGPDQASRRLRQLQPWTELGLADYTGFATYTTQFEWTGGECEIDLGEVRFAAVVTVDEQTFSLPLAPYRLRLNLPRGKHTLRVQVLNSNANRIYSGEDAGRSRFKGNYWMMYQFERAYRECGLLGPVTVTHLQRKTSLVHK